MTFFAHDVKHKQASAQSMPSVAAWVASGNKIERIVTPPAPPLRLLPVYHRGQVRVQVSA